MASQYYFRLKTMIENFRARHGVRNLPVVLGLDESHPLVRRHSEVVVAQEKLAKVDPCVIRVSMKDLPKMDHSHLNSVGLDKYGKRLFSAWKVVQKRKACSGNMSPK